MADYHGTSGNDDLDQSKLKLADWSGVIRGLAGNDKITGGNIHIQGGPGNDTLIGTTPSSTVNYWDAPKGIIANLKTGVVEDGWGDRDTLLNIHIIQGSSYPDTFIGSDIADNIWVGSGDLVFGGGGIDTVTIWESSIDWKITKLGNNKYKATKVLSGQSVELTDVERLQFQDVTLNFEFDKQLVYQENSPSLQAGQFLTGYSNDLNGDGRWDIVVCGGSFPPSPNLETAPQILIQNPDGTFQKPKILGTLEGFVHPREIATGDFNGDGIKDIVIAGHGYDIAPFAGETPTILLGQSDGNFKDISEVLPQTPAFTHSVAVADVNKDGLDDIFLGNIWGQQQFTPRLLLATKFGAYIECALPVSVGIDALNENGTLPIASLLKDLNGDGYVDLIAGGGTNGVFIYKGHQNLSTSTSDLFDANRLALPVGKFGAGNTITIDIQSIDINQDGHKDLILSQTSSSYQGRAIQVLMQTPNGEWIDETNIRIHGVSSSDQWITFINFSDLNQDGHLDLIATGSSDSQTSEWVNDGTGNYFPPSSSNGVPNVSGSYLLPAGDGRLFTVENLASGQLTISSISIQPGLTGPNTSFPAYNGAPGFNEQYYLNQHSVVADQVGSGIYSSGLANYLEVGKKLGYRPYAPGTTVWGSELIDSVTYAGLKSNYLLERLSADLKWSISGGSTGASTDKLIDVERIQFGNVSVALDLSGNAGETAKILGAVFGKESLGNKNYVGIGLSFLDTGWTYDNLARLALDAAGAKTNDQIVSLLWKNVIGAMPTQADKQPFIALLENGMTAGALAHMAADSSFNKSNINLIGLSETGIEYLPVT